MQRLVQTRTHDREAGVMGNCWVTCLASILEVPADHLPDWQYEYNLLLKEYKRAGKEIVREEIEDYSWSRHYERVCAWLREKFDLGLLEIVASPELELGMISHDSCLHIANGKSPRGFEHAVVMLGEDMIHDPHPDGGGLVSEPSSYTYLVSLGQKTRS